MTIKETSEEREIPDGQSPAMRALIRQLGKVAPSRHSVLLTGESGTGKSRLARWIHERSPRAGNPFMMVSCAALPKDLLESELFGHEKGAFSGAIRRKAGRVEMADKGTLFLDEIGEMPLELQPKLLTFLQDRSFFRVGGHELFHVNVRLIAATNRNLAAMVREGTFREDLFYRLNVLPLYIPPLRERQDEIPSLALHFLRKAVKDFSGPKDVGLSMDALDLLLHYSWPGNIRELENAMYRAATLVDSDGEVGPELIAPRSEVEIQDGNEVEFKRPAEDLVRTLDEVERDALLHALRHFQGHKPSVAVALGISEKSVYNKMKRLGIESRDTWYSGTTNPESGKSGALEGVR